MNSPNSCNGIPAQNPTQFGNSNCSSHMPRHRSLTPARVLRGVLCLIIYISSAFMMLVYFAPFFTIAIRLFSVHYSRKAVSILFGAWLALWPFLFEKINKTKVIFSGHSVPEKERVLIVVNHRTEVDWMYLWDLALRKHCLGYIKYILKSSLMKLPIFGWAFHILEFISVERKWEIDEPVIREMLSTFQDPHDPLWLALFPEGTDYSEQKSIRCQKFAAENNLPILKSVLLPKTKGFCACLDAFRNSLDSVYDITIGYKHRSPFFMDNVFGIDPSEVHIHIQRIPVNEIPVTEDDAAAWLIEQFKIKDELLSYFADQGHFPNEGIKTEISTFKCLINIVPILALTCIFTYLTFFFFWFKMYVTLSCVYLTTTTYFNVRPSPVFGSIKTFICRT